MVLEIRSGNRTTGPSETPYVQLAALWQRFSTAEQRADGRESARQPWCVLRAQRRKTRRPNQEESQVFADIWKHLDLGVSTWLDCKIAISLSELLDGWSPQHSLAKKDDRHRAVFSDGWVKFIARGRILDKDTLRAGRCLNCSRDYSPKHRRRPRECMSVLRTESYRRSTR